MSHPLWIFSGAAVQVNLYDATNGIYHLGYIYVDGGMLTAESLNAALSGGLQVGIRKRYSFSFPVIQTDTAGAIAEIETRKGTAQSVFIIGNDVAVQIDNCFVSLDLERSLKAGEIHKLVIKGSTIKQADVEVIVNLLGTDGQMNTDGGGGLCEGWTNSGATALSVAASYLGGGNGNEQRLTLSDSGDQIYYLKTFPLDAVPIQFTISGYFDNRKAGISYFRLGVVGYDSDDVSTDVNYSEQTLANGADGRKSYTVTFIPSADIKSVAAMIQGSDLGTAQLGIDNVQLELGELAPFTTG